MRALCGIHPEYPQNLCRICAESLYNLCSCSAGSMQNLCTRPLHRPLQEPLGWFFNTFMPRLPSHPVTSKTRCLQLRVSCSLHMFRLHARPGVVVAVARAASACLVTVTPSHKDRHRRARSFSLLSGLSASSLSSFLSVCI